jgi:hypothetical protein
MNTIKQQVFSLMDEGITKRAVIYSKIKEANPCNTTTSLGSIAVIMTEYRKSRKQLPTQEPIPNEQAG